MPIGEGQDFKQMQCWVDLPDRLFPKGTPLYCGQEGKLVIRPMAGGPVAHLDEPFSGSGLARCWVYRKPAEEQP